MAPLSLTETLIELQYINVLSVQSVLNGNADRSVPVKDKRPLVQFVERLDILSPIYQG